MSGGGSPEPMTTGSLPERPGSKPNSPPSGPNKPAVLACDCERVQALIALAEGSGEHAAIVRLTHET